MTQHYQGMEFLRFGSSIPGGYWGCCAVCIVQNFKVDPKAKSSIQLVSGDGGQPLGDVYMGPTNEDIFRERIRTGTFSTSDMPNHIFLAVLADFQVTSEPGLSWLKILKEEGFEFIRTTDNSVYTGAVLGGGGSPHKNYLFGLFRNIAGARVKDPFTPPKAWTDLKSVGLPEVWELMDEKGRIQMAVDQTAVHTGHWKKHGPTKFMTEAQLKKAGAPIIVAGRRLPHAQPETKEEREKSLAEAKVDKASAFPSKVMAA